MDMATTARPRRTQAQRREGTRRCLLDATLDCLVEYGWSGATTTVIADSAGVSRGAQLHHFPTRADLVAAAIEHLFDRMRREYREAFSRADGTDAAAAVDLLWSMFERPHFAAVLELYVAARTDAELRRKLVPVAQAHQEHVYHLAAEFFPQVPAETLGDALRTILDAMQGMAVAAFMPSSAADRDSRLEALRRLATAVIGDGRRKGKVV